MKEWITGIGVDEIGFMHLLNGLPHFFLNVLDLLWLEILRLNKIKA